MQDASAAYTEILKQHAAQISMSRKGHPYDNAACGSFMKTLKQEEVYRNECRDSHEARASICHRRALLLPIWTHLLAPGDPPA